MAIESSEVSRWKGPCQCGSFHVAWPRECDERQSCLLEEKGICLGLAKGDHQLRQVNSLGLGQDFTQSALSHGVSEAGHLGQSSCIFLPQKKPHWEGTRQCDAFQLWLLRLRLKSWNREISQSLRHKSTLAPGVSAPGWSHGASDFDDLVINLELLPCEEINTHTSLQTFGLLIN